MRKVIVVIGPGSIGQAIARRVGAGKHLLLADRRQDNADAAAKTLSEAGFEVTTMAVDVSSRGSVEALVAKASSLGDVHGVIHAAGVSPSQAAPARFGQPTRASLSRDQIAILRFWRNSSIRFAISSPCVSRAK